MYTITVGLAFNILVLGTAFISTVSWQVILCHHKNATTNRIQIIIYFKKLHVVSPTNLLAIDIQPTASYI